LEAEKCTTVVAVVQKLLEAGFIGECQYLEWLSNVISLKNPNGTWRIYVDFLI